MMHRKLRRDREKLRKARNNELSTEGGDSEWNAYYLNAAGQLYFCNSLTGELTLETPSKFTDPPSELFRSERGSQESGATTVVCRCPVCEELPCLCSGHAMEALDALVALSPLALPDLKNLSSIEDSMEDPLEIPPEESAILPLTKNSTDDIESDATPNNNGGGEVDNNNSGNDSNSLLIRNQASSSSRLTRNQGASSSRYVIFRRHRSIMFAGPNNGVREKRSKQTTLPEDSFSFLVCSKFFSIPYFSAMFILAIQYTSYLLLTFNVVDPENSKNPWGIPVDVQPAVRATQLVAVVITTLTQDDVRTGMNEINNWYDPKELGSAFEHINVYKWIFSILMRLCEGSLGFVVTFILIVTAESVLDLLLNFTAMEFVSQLDEIFFLLASQGFVGVQNKAQAYFISETQYNIVKKKYHLHPVVLILLTMIAMLTGWVKVMRNQINGSLLCESTMVQFGDDFPATLGSFSGMYDRVDTSRGIFEEKRVIYIDRATKGKSMFAYCEDLDAWTFSIHQTNGWQNNNPCAWVTKSPETDSFDILDVATDQWIVRDAQEGRGVVLPYFYMSCFDCDEIDDPCASHGICSNGLCECDEERYGPRCEFSSPCESIAIDERYAGFLGIRTWSTNFKMLKLSNNTSVSVYGRPVYFNEFSPGQFDVILFAGRRWAITYSDLLYDVNTTSNEAGNEEILGEYLQNNFHAHWSNFSVRYLSEPMSKNTPSDVSTPVGLTWYYTKAKEDLESLGMQAVDDSIPALETVLLCTVCDDDVNPCLYDGICDDNGNCDCICRTSGTLCQITPDGDGHCDPKFNIPEFEQDGGDCCESSCSSSDDYTCGKDETNIHHVGYRYCKLPRDVWQLEGTSFIGEAFARPPLTLGISRSGNILAVGETKRNRIRLFDRDGSDWVQRGGGITGPESGGFGGYVAVSGGLKDAVSNSYTFVPITVAVSVRPSSDAIGHARVFRCGLSGDCPQLGDVIQPNSGFNGPAVAISTDGHVVAVANGDVFSRRMSRYFVVVSQLDRNMQWVERGEFPPLNDVHSVALSGDGDTIAIGTLEIPKSVDTESTDVVLGLNRQLVFAWNGTHWLEKGDAIISTMQLSSSLFSEFALNSHAIALSTDGNTLAVGNPFGSKEQKGVKVFFYNGFQWLQKGDVLTSNYDGDSVGWNVYLSADGNTVATGMGVLEGEVHSWRFDVSNWAWTSMAGKITGRAKDSLAMSLDATTIAVATNQKVASVSTYERLPEQCQSGTSRFHMSLTFDRRPQDTTWDLVALSSNEILRQGGPYVGYERATVVYDTCLNTSNECYAFSIFDKFENSFDPDGVAPDGIEHPGNYTLIMAENEYPMTNYSSFSKSHFLGKCLKCPMGQTPVRVQVRACSSFAWKLKDGSGRNIFEEVHDMALSNQTNCTTDDISVQWREKCLILDGCYTFMMDSANDIFFHAMLYDEDELLATLSPDGSNTTISTRVGNCDEVQTEPLLPVIEESPDTEVPSDNNVMMEPEPSALGGPCDSFSLFSMVPVSGANLCGKLLDSNTAYFLIGDVSCPKGGPVLSNNTCLDCRGWKIEGSDLYQTAGIRIPRNASGATVYNCGVENFFDGITMIGDNNIVLHSEVMGNSDHGIEIGGTGNSVLCSKSADAKDNGIQIVPDSGATISGCLIENNGKIGVHLDNGSVSCSIIRDNSFAGIKIREDLRNTSNFFEVLIEDVVLSDNGYNVLVENTTSVNGTLRMNEVSSCNAEYAAYQVSDILAKFSWANLTCNNVVGEDEGMELNSSLPPCPAGDPYNPNGQDIADNAAEVADDFFGFETESQPPCQRITQSKDDELVEVTCVAQCTQTCEEYGSCEDGILILPKGKNCRNCPAVGRVTKR